MSPEAQEALVSLFRTMERVGVRRPTNAAVISAARSIGVRFREGEARTLLAKFRPKRGDRPGSVAVGSGTDQGPVSEHENTLAGPVGDRPGTDREGATRAGVVPVPRPESLPPSPNGLVPPKPGGRTRPKVPEVAFDPDDERRVVAILALQAAENETGKLTIGRVLTLRAELRAMLDEYGPTTWRYAMDESISRCKPAAYVRGVIRGASKRGGAEVLPFPLGGSSNGHKRFLGERPAEEVVAAGIERMTRREN